MNSLSTLVAIATARQEIRKSRFLAVAGPVSDEAAAKAFIAANSEQTANHNCWAWRIGQAYRFSDDGEPGGTAGKPILQASMGSRWIVSPSSSSAGSVVSCSAVAG